MWLFKNKLLVLFFLATLACLAATIILAVQKSNLQSDLDDCNNKIPAEDLPAKPEPPQPPPNIPAIDGYLLPKTARPIHYDISLYPNLNSGLFWGTVKIKVHISETSRELKIHSKGLTITNITVDGISANYEEDFIHELLIITKDAGNNFDGDNDILLEITYNGDMNNRIVGLYYSSYLNGQNQKRAMATSKFEPTYARQAFPCFDEPNMKAKFSVQLLIPKDDSSYLALSNMPQLENQAPKETPNGKLVQFKQSEMMSTYLACFIVCDFDKTEDTIKAPGKQDIPLKVYATPEQVSKTNFANEVAKSVMTYFLGYFDIEYPLPKLDLIAIPDFVSGAMEHWGLVTFRETALLYDMGTSSTANKQRIATVVSHELAHSWFGNLVTMNWWNDLWLNEGFATYIQYKGVHSYDSTWLMLDQFLIEDLHRVLALDSTTASHAIVVENIVTPDQITEIFDAITYSKGASVLRMLEGAVTEIVFKTGVKSYLQKHAFGNAVTQDLWDELQIILDNNKVDLDVTELMNTWTMQKGYPILDITEEGNQYIITQKRFLKDPESTENVESPYRYKWTIPVTYFTDTDKNSKLLWFKHTDDRITIPKPTPNFGYIKFNAKQVGYYRVNYKTPSLWKNLINSIEDMDIADKTHLIEETFSIAESGQLEYNIPLDLTKYLASERNYIPWSVAATKLKQLKKYVENTLEYPDFLRYVIQIATPAYKELKWEEAKNEPHLKRRARVTILELVCSMDHSECVQEAYSRFKNWLKNPTDNPISQDLRSIVYNYGMLNSGKEEWEKLYTIFKKENDANEKLTILRALAATKEAWLLKRLIELGNSEENVRKQDYLTMLQYISSNPTGTPIVWDYVRENWEYLVNKFTLNDRYLGRLLPEITKGFTTTLKLSEMESFFALNPEAGAGAAARTEAITNVKNNINWLEKNGESVKQWIKNNSQLEVQAV